MELSQVFDGKVIFGAFLILGLSALWLVATVVTKRRSLGNAGDFDKKDIKRVRAEKRADNDHFFAVLEAVEANQRLRNYRYELTEAEKVAQNAQMIEVSFETEQLDWALAHYDDSEFLTMAEVADFLHLPDLAKIIQDAAEVRTRFDERGFARLGGDDPEYVAVKDRILTLQASFRSANGVERVTEAASKFVEQNYDWRT